MFRALLRWIDAFIPAQVQADPDLHVRGRMLVESSLLVVPMTSIYAFVFYALGHPAGSVICLFGAVMAIIALWDFSKRGNFFFSGNVFSLVSFIVVGSLTVSTSGLQTLMSPWILMVAISGFLLVGIRSGIFWSAVSVIFVVVLFLLELYEVPLPAFVVEKYVLILNFSSLIGLIGYVVLILVNNDLGRSGVLADLRRVSADVERKNQQILSINQALESTVKKRTEGLIAANDELDTFLYESSHALRRPLMRIIGLMNLLKSNISEEEHEKFMDLIDYTAVNMDTMLQDLLIVSEVYQHSIVLKSIEVETEIERILAEMRINRAAIQIEVKPHLLWETDPELLEIMLRKVIDNAVAFQRNGEGHQIIIRAFAEGEHQVLEVQDNGMGIDPNAKPHLFKMFSRGTEKSRGSGLGLFIVRKIMDRLDGSVEIDSELGQQTTVKIKFS